MSILSISNISSGYAKKQVLFDVSLSIENGDYILLVGSNGSGKSTLLKVLYGLLPLWSGNIYYCDAPFHPFDFHSQTHSLIKKGIMYIPQQDFLFKGLTVQDNIKASLLHFNSLKETGHRLEIVYDSFPFLYKRRNSIVDNMSGGEKKILSLGMVVANSPKLLLIDEPLAGLSGDKIPIVLSCLDKVHNNGTTMIVVEHRISEIFERTNKVIGVKMGSICEKQFNSIEDVKKFMI